jgi:hypothetical protein
MFGKKWAGINCFKLIVAIQFFKNLMGEKIGFVNLVELLM